MFPQQLRKYRLRAGYTQEKLAQLVGVSKSTISMYELGQREPTFEMIEMFADLFNVNMATLVEGESAKNSRHFRVPVLGFVRAGIPIEAVEEVLDYEDISDEMARQGEYFALSIRGTSMEPKISEGDVVIVRKQDSVQNGDLAVVLINGNDATVKRFYQSSHGVKLVASNPTYDPMYFSPEEVDNLPVRVIGKVVELRAKF